MPFPKLIPLDTSIPWCGAADPMDIVVVPLCDRYPKYPGVPVYGISLLGLIPISGIYNPMQFGPTNAIPASVAMSYTACSSWSPCSVCISANPAAKIWAPATPFAAQSFKIIGTTVLGTDMHT